MGTDRMNHREVRKVEIEIDFKFLDKRLEAEYGLPYRSTPGSAAVDLRACIRNVVEIPPNGGVATFPAGFAMHITDNRYCALIIPRSGLGFKKGLRLRNGTGLIDSDYQGEIKICLHNTGDERVEIHPFERVAQMLIVPVYTPIFREVEDFGENSERGTMGFGESGRF